MRQRIPLILFILTALLVFTPLLQEHLHIFHFKRLWGVVDEKPQPELNLKNWNNHSIQNWTESYLKLHYGLREPLTRWYNQYQWDFYGINNLKNNRWIYISDDGWFYENFYVEEYYSGLGWQIAKSKAELVKKLDDEAFRVSQLQNILEKYGVHLFVMLEPGKEQIYPEHVPTNTPYPHNKELSAYEFYHKRFKELGVNCFDVPQWFLQIKDSVDFNLFPQTGTHWSNLASMYVADSLIRYMEQLGGMNIRNLRIGEKYQKTVFPDNDLESLMNLMRPLKTQPNYYANTALVDDSTAVSPKIITIGDSFYWNILNSSHFVDAFRSHPYWYYFSTIYFDPYHKNVSQVDLVHEVLSADFVMIAFNTTMLYELNKGFPQQLLLEMCTDEFDMKEAEEECVKTIRNNALWLGDVTQRAEEFQLPVDTFLMEEVRNSIQKNPSQFIPALRDTIPHLNLRSRLLYAKKKHLPAIPLIDTRASDTILMFTDYGIQQ